MHAAFFTGAAILLAGSLSLALVWTPGWVLFGVVLALTLVGAHDLTQTRRAILRNFPLIGHFRYLFEMIRPEISQYFIESNLSGRPFHREQRSVVYQRAKQERDTVPFGTQRDVYEVGYEWILHSVLARAHHGEAPRVRIGQGPHAYDAALLGVSAMSYGSLSRAAVESLSRGAARGGFALNTGEGGISPFHLAGGADLIWQIGTGYFGCRSADGGFDLERYRKNACRPEVKMIEVKLSQGAKPGHGGILPGAKVTEEIAEIRGVEVGKEVLSPPGHSAFETPLELLEFLELLRKESGGKPVGIKLCVGQPWEILALCKAMREADSVPDYIAVDGGEGGTGAAPLEFSNRVGSPLLDGLMFVHNALIGFDLRDRVKVIASGKIITGFDLARALALGADLAASARGMMMALGCIQARVCNTNHCPVGVATQNPRLIAGLDVSDKSSRVAAFGRETVTAMMELIGAAGLESPRELGPEHIQRRVAVAQVKSYLDLYPWLDRGALRNDPVPPAYEEAWRKATSTSFRPVV